jgi:carboxypeptidase Taq
VSVEDPYRAANKVEASLIRVEADELTYPLHIMIRYELERMIFSSDVDIDELPRLWNEKMEEYLQLTPKNDAEGILQDVHWSGGAFGYFPTYALGTAYSAQIYYTMQKELNIDEIIKNRDLHLINQWLKDKIHHYGSSKTPRELMIEVTNEEFNPQYYIRYLKEKYTDLYLK